jgi:hypothetical protein
MKTGSRNPHKGNVPVLLRDGTRMTNVLYSQAPRCVDCQGRALLTRPSADALASATAGRLHVFKCPAKDGWHVWAPDIELAPLKSQL